jgi:dihydroorotase
MRTLIRHGTIVLPTESMIGNVLIEDQLIADIDAAEGTQADEVVEARGLFLLPGVVDDHVHLREPGLTQKEDLASGSRACAAGGVTSFLDMPNTKPPTTTVARLHEKLDLAAGKSLVNYGFYLGATSDNLDEMRHAVRTPGIKLFIGSSTGNMLVDEQDALERLFAETTLPICAHCEDEATVRANADRLAGTTDVRDHSRIRDHEAAVIATRRTLDLARRHHHRFHLLHTSTGAEVDLLRDHSNLITGEACPHHLLFNTTDYERLGTRVQMNPSIKTPEDNDALWQALRDGALQAVATDHAPHLPEEKDQPYPQSPSGIPSVELSLPLMLDQVNRGRCTLQQVVSWMCDAPARIWDMVGKGRITQGADADLVLVDMNARWTVRNEDQVTRCGWTPWHGTELQGRPLRTWVMGREVFREGQFDESVRGTEIRFDHGLGGYWATR